MLTDYKFWYIHRDDWGFITEATIRFYEGEITTALEKASPIASPEPVTRYRRSKRLGADDLKHLKCFFRKEMGIHDVALYNESHFGRIKTDDELRAFLNAELAKDKGRTPIDEQKIK